MPDPIRAEMFRSLVRRAGGIEAAISVIESATGHAPSKSTVSEVRNGKAMLPAEWAEAMENHTGTFPFYNMRRRELEARAEEGASSPLDLTSAAAKEGGEALAWGMKAIASGKAGDHARAAVEAREAESSYSDLARHFEGARDDMSPVPTPLSERRAS